MYTSEMTQAGLRPLVGAISMITMAAGFASTFVVNAFVYWRTLAAVNAITCGVLLALQASLLLESHVWLIEKGRIEDGLKVLTKLRHHLDGSKTACTQA